MNQDSIHAQKRSPDIAITTKSYSSSNLPGHSIYYGLRRIDEQSKLRANRKAN